MDSACQCSCRRGSKSDVSRMAVILSFAQFSNGNKITSPELRTDRQTDRQTLIHFYIFVANFHSIFYRRWQPLFVPLCDCKRWRMPYNDVKWKWETVAPRIKSPEYATGVIGKTADIKCTVDAKPTPKVIFWRDHDGRIPVILGNNYRMKIDNDTEVSDANIETWRIPLWHIISCALLWPHRAKRTHTSMLSLFAFFFILVVSIVSIYWGDSISNGYLFTFERGLWICSIGWIRDVIPHAMNIVWLLL